jgi:hypothetical protein
MGALLELKARIIFVTASSIKENGKAREIVVESRPQYAVVQLNGVSERYSIAWEVIYELAKKQHAENLRIEARAESNYAESKRKKSSG